MARSIAAGGLKRTNTKYLLLALVLGLLSATLVYLSISRDSGGSDSTAAATVSVVVAKESIPAWTKITADMLEEQKVAIDARAEGAYASAAPAIGSLARYPIAKGEQVMPSKLAATGAKTKQGVLSYAIPSGKRAIAINVSKVVSAGGLVLPGDYVDVLLDFPKDGPYMTTMLLQNVEVTAVEQAVVSLAPEGTPTPGAAQRSRIVDGDVQPGATVVTLILSPEDAQRLFLAEQVGQIRLAVRAFGDNASTADATLDITDVVPKQYIPKDKLPPSDIP